MCCAAFWVTKEMTDTIGDRELKTRAMLAELIMFLLYLFVLMMGKFNTGDTKVS